MDLESTLSALAPNLLRFCTGIMRSVSEGEDLAQESLTALVRYWNDKGPPESPAAFVYTVARRQAGRFRRRWRWFLPPEAPDAHADPGCGPELASDQRQQVERTFGALKCLSRHEREALLLAIDESISVREAALALGVSVSAFKMRVHRARRRLLCRLEEGNEI